METETFDFVIIGAGSAGCVLADRLSQCGSFKVCVIEAGGSDRSPLIQVPAGVIYALGQDRFDWSYETEADASRCDRRETWPRGRVLGGSSSINGMFWVRGNRRDFDNWEALGNAGWGYRDVLPHFNSLETFAEAESGSDIRGTNGPLKVEKIPRPHRLCESFLDAAETVGLARNPDYNGAHQSGASIAQTSIHKGLRQNAAKAFLTSALRRPNVHLYSNSMVRRIAFDGTHASGVEVAFRGKERVLLARCEVIVAAGSIGSPHLLLRSGVGDTQHLSANGISTVNHLPGVGRNMQEHPGIWMVQSVAREIRTVNQDYNLAGKALHTLRFLFGRRGQLGKPTAQAMAFARSEAEETWPDIQIHFAPMGYRISQEGIEVLKTPAMMCIPSINRPESRGRVSLRTGDPDAPPRIQPNLLGKSDDLMRLTKAGRIVRSIFSAQPFAGVAGEEMFPGCEIESDDEWADILRKHAAPIYHVVGTCKMGQDAMAVVDERLNVKGVTGLRVVDSSIMPVITSGNTNAPTMMIAAKGAEMILSDARAKVAEKLTTINSGKRGAAA